MATRSPKTAIASWSTQTSARVAAFTARKSRHFALRGISVPGTPVFCQLNWVFDVFFVDPDVAEDLTKAGITGVSFGPALDSATGSESKSRVQLLIQPLIDCAEITRLPSVACRPDNDESSSLIRAGKKNYPPETPYCKRTKYLPPTSLVINTGALRDLPDLFQTTEWFGAGGRAFRLTLASKRFVDLVSTRGWRGLAFQ